MSTYTLIVAQQTVRMFISTRIETKKVVGYSALSELDHKQAALSFYFGFVPTERDP